MLLQIPTTISIMVAINKSNVSTSITDILAHLLAEERSDRQKIKSFTVLLAKSLIRSAK